MKRIFILIVVLFVTGCASLSGYDTETQYKLGNARDLSPQGARMFSQYGVTTTQDYDAKLAEMRTSGYSTSSDPNILLTYMQEKIIAQRNGTTVIAERDARIAKEKVAGEKQAADAKVAREKEAAEQKRKQLEFAKDYPYTAIITCGPGREIYPTSACFAKGSRYDAETELEIRNGDDYQMYQGRDVPRLRETRGEGLRIPLKRNFAIKAQNSSKHFLLTITVIESATGRVLYKKSASQYGVIRTSN